MIAKLYAARGFRRRSFDDQEGDNDINIILQPSDLDDIEKHARAKYANYLTSAAFGRIQTTTTTNNETTNNEKKRDFEQANETPILTTKRTSAMKSPKLTAMTNIFNDMKLAKCLLDQDYNQTVRLFIKKSALNWNFNSFIFDALCCGRSLTELLLHLFDHYNLYNIFKLDIVKVLKCFRLLEFGYHSTNPYHNSVHAADVTQAMHCFIQENKIKKHMTNLEILCAILAAVCHDLDHPGVNQSFLVATNNPLASLYQNNSVLENHHWKFALCIFKEAKLFDHFAQDVLDDMKEQLKHLILATDIARQNEYLKRFKDLTSSHHFSMQNTDDRALVLQMALKCADLGNPCRPWLISRVWSQLICDEFYRMGQIERRLGVPLTPICQREKTSIAGIQADFFRFIVLPLLELWHKFLESPLSDLLMSNFDHNYKRWQRANRIVQQLRRRKSFACLEPVQGGLNGNDAADNINDDKSTYYAPSTNDHNDNHSATRLLFDPAMATYYSMNPFEASKRASSDYIKSGNGKLELLRNFQLDRIIERSPLMAKSNKFCTKVDTRELMPIETSQQQMGEQMNKTTATTSKFKDPNIAKKSKRLTTNEPRHRLPPTPRQSNPTTAKPSCGSERSCCSRTNFDSSQASRRAQSVATITTTATATTTAQATNSSQELSNMCPSYRKVLSPIQDGEGPSPEIQGQDCEGDNNCAPPNYCSTSSKTTTTSTTNVPSKSSESSGSSSLVSRASSACSSPVMQCSFSPRTSNDQTQHKHIKHHQKQHQYRTTAHIQNHPFLAQYYEPSSGTKSKPSNLSSARQSVSVSLLLQV